jgi:hypothetical protein
MHAIELLPPPVRRLGRRTADRLGFDIDRDPFPIRLCVVRAGYQGGWMTGRRVVRLPGGRGPAPRGRA